jgi:hypothetical protein
MCVRKRGGRLPEETWTAYQARVATRSKVREAMIAEGLIKHDDPVAA